MSSQKSKILDGVFNSLFFFSYFEELFKDAQVDDEEGSVKEYSDSICAVIPLFPGEPVLGKKYSLVAFDSSEGGVVLVLAFPWA